MVQVSTQAAGTVTIVVRFSGRVLKLALPPTATTASLHAAVHAHFEALAMGSPSGRYALRFRPGVGPPRPVSVPASEAETLASCGLAAEPTTMVTAESAAGLARSQ